VMMLMDKATSALWYGYNNVTQGTGMQESRPAIGLSAIAASPMAYSQVRAPGSASLSKLPFHP